VHDPCCDTSYPALGRRGLLGASLGMTAAVATAPVAAAAGTTKRRPHRVLVFTRTTSFRHASIPVAISTIGELCASRDIPVEATEDPRAFSRKNLQRFTAVVFANTTGNVLDTTAQRRAFRRFVLDGGGWVGVHSAADTEYSSAFYTRLLAGARFLAHPLQQPGVVVREDARHRSTRHLDARWTIPFEEFYSFTSSPRGRARVLLSIDESTYLQDPNTTNLPSGPDDPLPSPGVTGVMGDHPMSWQHDVGRGVAWYTALGHEVSMYSDPDFRAHLLGGLVTATRRGHRRLS
jgi:type 1 glutamine amidotransferase